MLHQLSHLPLVLQQCFLVGVGHRFGQHELHGDHRPTLLVHGLVNLARFPVPDDSDQDVVVNFVGGLFFSQRTVPR